MVVGVLFTMGAALYGASYVLASYAAANTRYLESYIKPTLGVYESLPQPTHSVELEEIEVVEPVMTVDPSLGLFPTRDTEELLRQVEATKADSFEGFFGNSPSPIPSYTPTGYVVEVDPYELQPPPTITPTPMATPTATPIPTETPTPMPSPIATEKIQPEPVEPSQPVVRLLIPRLNIDSAVVEIGTDPDKGWDTDSLFATKNRPDLIGHLQGSALPGEGSNIVLAGHNYDFGIFQWNGVFVNLKQLQPGDQIAAYTQGGEEYVYVVEKVKEIPFIGGNEDELFKHAKHLGPTETERLTLVTCGGANLLNWNKRVYVLAYPVNQ